MKTVAITCVILWVLVIGAVLWSLRKEKGFPEVRKMILSPVRPIVKAFYLRWDRMIAHRGVRAFRRHIVRALKKGNKISVDIDRDHLIDLRKMSKHDLEKMCAMITATLQMYEAVYGSDLVNRIVHKWPGETRQGKGKK